jgi:ABC-type multidrug transport system ATPase subunit
VAIARSLINNPSIILADEPVGNLDSESSENVMKILKDLNEVDKKTVILVTHNAEHLHYADRIIYMKDGKVISEEINKDKRPKEAVEEEIAKQPDIITNELKLLMRMFKNFSPQQAGSLLVPYKAKQLLYHVILELTDEQLQAAEGFLRELLFQNFDAENFEKNLDMNLDKGGAGWNKLRAKSFSERVRRIIEQAGVIETEQGNAAEKLAEYLADLFEIKMKREDKARLAGFLRLRIENKVDCFGLQERLDAPFALGGVGLYKSTAEKMVKETEMIMLLKFSIK